MNETIVTAIESYGDMCRYVPQYLMLAGRYLCIRRTKHVSLMLLPRSSTIYRQHSAVLR